MTQTSEDMISVLVCINGWVKLMNIYPSIVTKGQFEVVPIPQSSLPAHVVTDTGKKVGELSLYSDQGLSDTVDFLHSLSNLAGR